MIIRKQREDDDIMMAAINILLNLCHDNEVELSEKKKYIKKLISLKAEAKKRGLKLPLNTVREILRLSDEYSNKKE